MFIDQLKLKAGRYMVPVTVREESGKLWLKFRFNRSLLDEIKLMKGAKWHGYDPTPVKEWSVDDCARNRFQIQYLEHSGRDDPLNPYRPYDVPLLEVNPRRRVYGHQVELFRHVVTRRHCILAAEMRTGKTLVAIEVMEHSGYLDWWWVGPRSALLSVSLEFDKWDTRVRPRMFTYEGLKRLLAARRPGDPAPHGVVFDESSRGKNPTAQRTQAMQFLADSIRREHGRDSYVVLMSGSPAPKSPVDWWSQCISGDTLVLTQDGPRRIDELQNEESYAYADHRLFKASRSWSKGQKQLYKIRTKEGYEVRATEDHKFLIDYEGICLWQELKDLTSDDKIVLHDHEEVTWDGLGTFEEGYVIGHFYGDGSWHNECPRWYVREKDHELIPYLRKLMPDMTLGSEEQGGRICIRSKIGTRIIREFGEDLELCGRSSDFLEGFIAGLFDTDGSAEKGRARVEIAQSDRNLLVKVQQALIFLGIKSTLREHKEDIHEIEGRQIRSEKRWRLLVSGEYAHRFAKRIGFRLSYKRLPDGIRNYGKEYGCATIESIEPDGVEEVFDLSVQDVHCFSANGLMAHNCEIACPGFLREGSVDKFRSRLAVIEYQESPVGGKFPRLVTWRDDERKCGRCGRMEDSPAHDARNMADVGYFHPFERSENEIVRLYRRMNGLVAVKFKKDCLDLPEKVFRVVRLPVSIQTMNLARLVQAKAPTAAQALILLRELSDGFQYQLQESGARPCGGCEGTGRATVYADGDRELTPDEISQILGGGGSLDQFARPGVCSVCGGSRQVPGFSREVREVATPKEGALVDQLDEHDEVGRLVVYAGFLGSVDRVVRVCLREKWEVVRVDGRGWLASWGERDPKQMMLTFQDRASEDHPRVVFVGQPGAGGMGLDLAASPTILYYSNDFNGESRIQSVERIHGPTMDRNLGATIIDLVHLPTDELVLDNLNKKRRLQSITMGELQEALAVAEEQGPERYGEMWVPRDQEEQDDGEAEADEG